MLRSNTAGCILSYRVIQVQPAALPQLMGHDHAEKNMKGDGGKITKGDEHKIIKWNPVLHLKRTSKEMFSLRRQYFAVWRASPMSPNPSPSIPLSWWDGWWWTCTREGGRKRGIIPSEYMMNVVARLKLTRGRVAHRDRERACEWHRAPSSTLPCSYSQSLHPPPEDSQRESHNSQDSLKERTNIYFLFQGFFVKLRQEERGNKELKVNLSLLLARAHLEFVFSSPRSKPVLSVQSLKRREDAEQHDRGWGGRGGTQ